jgi:predicted RND superfamily exporter protein
VSEETGARQRWDVAFRAWLEDSLARWGGVAARHPWPPIALQLLVALALGSQLGKLEIETSTETLLRDTDPARVVYDEFRRQFGREEVILISVHPPEVFDLDFLAKLRDFHTELEESVPHLDEVTSLVNARETLGRGDELIVRELLEEWPETPAELASLKRRVLSNPLYGSLLISDDGRTAVVIVRTSAYSSLGGEADDLADFDDAAADEADAESSELAFITGHESGEVVQAVNAIVARYRGPDFEMHLAGAPVMSFSITEELKNNTTLFSLLSIIAVSALLLLLFRRVSAVLLSLSVVGLSVVSTFGVMAISGEPIGLPTQILPSFLLAVGVGATVHLLVIFYQAFDGGASREDAIVFAMGHSGLAIIMTSLTTAGGLFSFVAAEIAPVALLGVLGPVGILLGLLYCLLLLPALLAVTPVARRARRTGDAGAGWIQHFLLWTGDRCVRFPWVVVICMSIILLVSIVGITRLRFEYDPLRWFPETNAMRQDMELIDRELKGNISLEIIVDTGRENGLHEPRILRGLDRLRAKSDSYVREGGLFVGKALSIADIAKEIHQALNENRPEYYAIAPDRQLIAQELLLFESSGSDDLEDFVDSQFQKARMTFKMPYVPPLTYAGLIDEVMEDFRRELGDEVEITATGFVTLITRSLNAVSISMMRSYVMALAVITPLMFLLLGTLRGGTAAMVPNLAPIILTLGLMGWIGMPLGLFTLMIGSIAIGLAVDNTIHFMHNFRKYYEESGDVRQAVRETLTTTGHALLVAATSLSIAFFIYAFAEMQNLFRFGLLTGFTILTAFIAGITVSPALMALAARRDRPAMAESGGGVPRGPSRASEVGSTPR